MTAIAASPESQVQSGMRLRLLLPFGIFADKDVTLRIVAETREGSFGLLPNRLDCVAALAPGILTYETKTDGEVFTAIDAGVLVKTGLEVLVSVRHAISGKDLAQLRDLVDKEFLNLDEQERSSRAAMDKLESSLLRRMVSFQHE